MTLSSIAQLLIPLLWLPASYCVLHLQRKGWGYLAGTLAYPLSLSATLKHGLWGMAVVELISCLIWVTAGWKYLMVREAKESKT